MNDKLLQELAPTGVLRAGINLSNALLVTSIDDNGVPGGVSPDMARAMAAKLGVDVELVTYPGPGEVADAAINDAWDIANIAAEPERARAIDFSPAYCEIQATYLVPAGSSIQTVAEVDTSSRRIAVKERAAYELWLSEHLKQASLIKAPSHDAAYSAFVDQSLDAMAGLRPQLIELQKELPGSRLLDSSFTSVQQAIGCRKNKPHACEFIKNFVYESLTNGLVARLIAEYGVVGKLSASAAVSQ